MVSWFLMHVKNERYMSNSCYIFYRLQSRIIFLWAILHGLPNEACIYTNSAKGAQHTHKHTAVHSPCLRSCLTICCHAIKSPNAHFQRLAVHQHYHHKSTSFTSSIKWDEYWSAKEDLFISSSIQRSTASSFWWICWALTAQSYCIHDTGLDISVLEENQTVNSVQ